MSSESNPGGAACGPASGGKPLTGTKPPTDGFRRRIVLEILLISVLVLLVAILEGWSDFFDDLATWALQRVPLETQDIFLILTLLSVALAVFSLRRWNESEKELSRRRQAEEALRESEARMRAMLDTAEDVTFLKDTSFRYIDVNPAMERRMGLPRGEIVGKRAQELFNEEHASRVQRADERVLNGEVIREDRTFQYRDRRYEVNVVEVPIRDTEGRVVALFGISRDITVRKRAEQALKESETNFRELAQNASDGLAILNEQGDYLYVNRQAAEMSGYTVEELLTMNFRQLAHPDEHKLLAERLAARLRGEEVPKQYEVTGIHKDGRHRLLELTSSKTTWRGELVDLVVIRDVTESRAMERALRESQQQSQAIFDATSDAIFIKDRNFRYREVNRAWLERLDLTLEQVIGKTDEDIFESDAMAMVRRANTRAMAGEIVQEDRTFTYHGKTFEVDILLVPIRNVEGQIVRLFGVSRDISERKSAERALRASEARYRAVVEDQQDFIARWDPDLKITFVNEALCRYLGMTKEELVGTTFMPLIPQEDYKRVEEYYASLGPHNPVTTIEHRVITPSGEIRWQEWTNRLLLDSEGNMVEGQSVGRDITKRKWAEEALRQSESHIRGIFDAATTVAFIRADLDGLDSSILEFSQGAQNLFGYTPEEAVGEPLGILYTEEGLTGFPELIETVRTTKKPATRRLKMVRRTGEQFSAQATMHVICDVNGDVTGLLIVIFELEEDR